MIILQPTYVYIKVRNISYVQVMGIFRNIPSNTQVKYFDLNEKQFALRR